MSKSTSSDLSKPFVAAVVPLLKEYLDKLRSIAEQAQQLRDLVATERLGAEKKRLVQLKYDLLTQLAQRLRPPATHLAQQVSQRIEHGNLDEVDRVELRLRLAEFEHALLSVQSICSSPLAA